MVLMVVNLPLLIFSIVSILCWCRFVPSVQFLFILFWRDSSQWARASSFMRFLDHTFMTHHSR